MERGATPSTPADLAPRLLRTRSHATTRKAGQPNKNRCDLGVCLRKLFRNLDLDPHIAGRRGACRSKNGAISGDVISRYLSVMTKQTTVRLPEELADQAEAVARVRGTSMNQLIVESLASEIERVRADKDFTDRAQELLERDKELLDRLAR